MFISKHIDIQKTLSFSQFLCYSNSSKFSIENVRHFFLTCVKKREEIRYFSKVNLKENIFAYHFDVSFRLSFFNISVEKVLTLAWHNIQAQQIGLTPNLSVCLFLVFLTYF